MFVVWPPLPVWWRLDAAVVIVVAYSALICLFNHYVLIFEAPDWGSAAAGLNAIILGLLLGFRNAQSYDRWWEARKLWGQLVNDSRNLLLKSNALPKLTSDDRDELRRIVSEFPTALREHLRIPSATHRPLALAGEAMRLVQVWRAAGRITEFDMLILDPQLSSLMNITGACERIRGTPLPLSYRSLLRHGLVLLLAVTPIFIVEKSGWWSVLAMGMLAYFLLGIELTAESIENPFEGDFDDLPLESYGETIQKSVNEAQSALASENPYDFGK